MRELEEDEGLRIVGRMPELARGGFLFVSVHQGEFHAYVCDRVQQIGRKTFRGEKGEWHEFGTFDEAWKFVLQRIRRPVQAWCY